MKRSLSLIVLAVAALAVAQPVTVTVADLLAKADAYHDKQVKTTGTVENFQQKTSRAGNDYFTFRISEGPKGQEKRVNVYGHGKLEPKPENGVTATVTGLYRKEKKSGDIVFKNEIEAKPKDIVLSPGK
jgi:hypothetical protein